MLFSYPWKGWGPGLARVGVLRGVRRSFSLGEAGGVSPLVDPRGKGGARLAAWTSARVLSLGTCCASIFWANVASSLFL